MNPENGDCSKKVRLGERRGRGKQVVGDGGVMQEKGDPFAGVAVVLGRAATEFVAAISAADEAGATKGGDEFPFVVSQILQDA